MPILSAAHLEKGGGEESLLFEAGNYLFGKPAKTKVVSYHLKPLAHYYGHVTLKMGANGAHVRFQFLRNQEAGPRLRIEFNPRKLSQDGFLQLIAILTDPQGPFVGASLVEQAKITRLDVATDVIGASVREMLPWSKDQGKRSYYVGDDGELETIYIHRKKKLPKPKFDKLGNPKTIKHQKPAGAVILSVYDKVRERKSILEPPPFGKAPVTRIERRRTYNKKLLSEIPSLPDPFQDTRVGMVTDGDLDLNSNWHLYVAARRTLSSVHAAKAVNLNEQDADDYEVRYAGVSGNLIKAASNWQYWPVGIKMTGLAKLLALKS